MIIVYHRFVCIIIVIKEYDDDGERTVSCGVCDSSILTLLLFVDLIMYTFILFYCVGSNRVRFIPRNQWTI